MYIPFHDSDKPPTGNVGVLRQMFNVKDKVSSSLLNYINANLRDDRVPRTLINTRIKMLASVDNLSYDRDMKYGQT